ncbi:unnamed protein product [Effrenium voratum]|uniref:TauD/TfdA-like domain-containing protein n=1 Tax=Effrenium voratum TaxID=2562239 RepID=A0AA36HW21_9DINO|nr:unnamed protein product [Effrenium voratum]
MMLILLLSFGGAFGLSGEVAAPVLKCPSIRLSSGPALQTTWHPDATPETVAAFQAAVPFQSLVYHTVSSGRNLVVLMPTLRNEFKMGSTPGNGLKARSLSQAGTLFLRHDQMVVLTYGTSRDHESFMPPILSVVAEDLPALEDFGKKVWAEQLHGTSKEPFTLTFTFGELAAGPLFKDELTGNHAVDDVVAVIRSRTTDHWLVAPQELVKLMFTGDALGLEGTEGYIFPPMVIANGVFMVLSTYAHSGVVNSLASLFDEGVALKDLHIIKRVVNRIGDSNLPYLRSLSLHMICDTFNEFFSAFNQAQTVAEVNALLGAMSLFGAVVHGWFVYLFPYRLGVELRRAPSDMFKIQPLSDPSVPLRSRDGRGLGVATWHVGSPEDREQVSNMHLPASLAGNGSLPLILRWQPSKFSLAHLAVAARAKIEEHSSGAILFRGLPLPTFSDASDFIAALGYAIYPDPSGREKVADTLCHSSLAVEPDINIAPHQEHIVSKQPPSKLVLYCQAPSPEGGQTPLAHAGNVWDLLPEDTREQLRRRGVKFEMVRGNAAQPGNPVQFTRSWQSHFDTDDLTSAIKKASEQFDGEVDVDEHGNILMRSGLLQAVHEVEGREIYRSQLQNIYSLKWLWGDSDEYINDKILEHVMSAVWNAATVFQWQAGDLLIINNHVVLHGRLSYTGERLMGVGLTRD